MKKVTTTLLHSIWSTTTTTEASYEATEEYEDEEEEEEDENYSLSTEPFTQSTKMNALQTLEEAMKDRFGSKLRTLTESFYLFLKKNS